MNSTLLKPTVFAGISQFISPSFSPPSTTLEQSTFIFVLHTIQITLFRLWEIKLNLLCAIPAWDNGSECWWSLMNQKHCFIFIILRTKSEEMKYALGCFFFFLSILPLFVAWAQRFLNIIWSLVATLPLKFDLKKSARWLINGGKPFPPFPVILEKWLCWGIVINFAEREIYFSYAMSNTLQNQHMDIWNIKVPLCDLFKFVH